MTTKKRTVLPFKRTSVKAEKGFLNPGLSDTKIEPGLLRLKEEQEIDALAASISGLSNMPGNNGIMLMSDNSEDEAQAEKDEIEKFLAQPDYAINNIDKSASIKTNFYLLNNNLTALVKYLKNLKHVAKWVYEHLQIDQLILELIDKFQTDKLMIPVAFDIPITGTRIHESGKDTYKITRIDNYIIDIECLTRKNWNVDRLMIQVKNNDYVIVYPRIATVENKITIDFIDKVATNYNVFIV